MILVIDKSKINAINLSNIFYYLGILSDGCTPSEALSKISPLYRAILFNSPDTHADLYNFILQLRRYSPGTPIFAISDDDNKYEEYFRRVFSSKSLGSRLAFEIIDYCEAYGIPAPGHYTISGFDASFGLSASRYYDDILPFTKTENMILKALIRAYPTPLTPGEILSYSYRNAKRPEPSNIRTHLSIMNKKFHSLTGRNLVTTAFGKGYTLLTPADLWRDEEKLLKN